MVNSKNKNRDKSKEFHFHLVSRSLADPNCDQPGEAQSVLQPFVPKNDYKKGRYPDQAPGPALGLDPEDFGFHENLDDQERAKLQEIAYGGDGKTDAGTAFDGDEMRLDYFPRDGYDYERHLRTVGLGAGKLLAAPGKGQQAGTEGLVDVDAPEVSKLSKEEQDAVAALNAADEYVEAGDVADDDFFADLVGDEEEAQDIGRRAMFGQYLEEDDEEWEDEDRPAGELDSAFDALLGEYDDDKLGALDEEDEVDLCGSQRIDTFDHLLEEHIEKPLERKRQNRAGLDEHLDDDKSGLLDMEDTPLDDYDLVKVRVKPEFDCESILSLRSNISNHPGKVDRPDSRRPKREKPAPAAPIPEDEEDVIVLPEVSTLRPKDETPEERKARKASVKEHQRACRAMKKETKLAFKAEAKKAHVQPNAGDLREGVKHRPL